jgi:MFS transporter, FSR family, fosmidomycin resistance protein
LSYAEVGLALAIPGFIGCAFDPLIGLLGDTPRRRALLVLGGIGFALSTVLSSVAVGFMTLLAALAIGNPATGAFVSLSQATLMDLEPARRERNMARWTLVGSIGYVAGPLILAAGPSAGLGWRPAVFALGVCAVPLAVLARRSPRGGADGRSLRGGLGHAAVALGRADVVRWLALLEAGDLLVDVFHGFLALYFVDVARVDARAAALAVAVWTGAGFVGDAALLLVLRRMNGHTYLRFTAVAALVVYPAFLVVDAGSVKLLLLALLGLLNSGWYAIPQAGLYGALPDRSGIAVAVGGIGGIVGAAVPLTLGLIASAIGLGATMWILLLAPLALAVGVPRRQSASGSSSASVSRCVGSGTGDSSSSSLRSSPRDSSAGS